MTKKCKVCGKDFNIDENLLNPIFSEFAKTVNVCGDDDCSKKIREKRLRDVITSQEAGWWKVLSRNVYLSEDRIELDKRLIKNY